VDRIGPPALTLALVAGLTGAAAAQTATPVTPADPAAASVRGAPLETGGFGYQRGILEGPAQLVALPLDAAVLAHSQGPSRSFADVRIVDDQNLQIPYVLEQRAARLTVEAPFRRFFPTLRELTTRAGIARTFYRVTLPYENLPQPVLTLETSEQIFLRSIELGAQRPADRRHRTDWFESFGRTSWHHANPRTPPPPLEIPFSRSRGLELLLIVEEGDNQPLPISAVRLLLPGWQLRFFRPASPIRLLYGRPDLTEPRYDLAMLAPSAMSGTAREITAVPEAVASQPAALVSPRAFWIGLSLAVLALLALIVRLLSRTGRRSPRPAP
jgi:hypothetical protein